MRDAQILETALRAVNQITRQNQLLTIVPSENADDNIWLQLGKHKFKACIKKWVPQMKLGALIYQLQDQAENGILVADYVNASMGDTLQKADIQYIDTVGNGYINRPPVFICIKGNKPEKTASSYKPGKSFQTAGLKIVLAFLCHEELLNRPYRAIAEKAGTALATVGEVIKDLEQASYLTSKEGKSRTLVNKKQLQQRWAEAYPHRLRDKHYIGTFTTDNPMWWQAINPQDFGGQWGGEIAAAEYTQYLSPKDAIVYLPRSQMAGLMKAARLRKVKPHEHPITNIQLFEPSWTVVDGDHALAPPIVVYADLLDTGDSRNIETASKLYEQHLG